MRHIINVETVRSAWGKFRLLTCGVLVLVVLLVSAAHVSRHLRERKAEAEPVEAAGLDSDAPEAGIHSGAGGRADRASLRQAAECSEAAERLHRTGALLMYYSEVERDGRDIRHVRPPSRPNACDPGTRAVGIRHDSITAEQLPLLSQLAYLQHVDVAGPGVTSEGLRHLCGLSELRILVLRNTDVDDDGLAHLKQLTQLESLILEGTQITDEGMRHLATLTELRALDVTGTRITDAGLEHLRPLRKLEALWLANTNLTGIGLKHLHALWELQFLDLSETKLTDASLVHLIDLPSLSTLDLNDTRITDAGLPVLGCAANCSLTVHAERTRVTPEAWEDYRAEMQRAAEEFYSAMLHALSKQGRADDARPSRLDPSRPPPVTGREDR